MRLTAKETSTLDAIYRNNRIPLWIYEDDTLIYNNLLTLPDIIRIPLGQHICRLICIRDNQEFHITHANNELYYQFHIKRKSHNLIAVGGPMLLYNFYHLIEMQSLSFSSQMNSKELRCLLEHLPIVSLQSFISCLDLHLLVLTGISISYDTLYNYQLEASNSSMETTFFFQLFDNTEEIREHTPYSHEVAVLNCVRDGDMTRLQTTYRTLPRVVYGKMSDNPLRQMFYGCIANTTLITRYAIEGGMDEEEAFTLSDVYIKRMERCKDIYELNILNERMALDFTKRVAKSKQICHSPYSRPVKQCMRYIRSNLHDRITLKDLSKISNLTPKYLSALFIKETGEGINSHIENLKIQEAKDLLTYSSYTYGEIAQLLAFHSQSYFIQVFKKRVGMTPKEYRW